jgi:hypothetical protein
MNRRLCSLIAAQILPQVVIPCRELLLRRARVVLESSTALLEQHQLETWMSCRG